MLKKLDKISGSALPFFKEDIDTDQIIPARFLKGTSKTGLGQFLFYDWRYDDQGQIKNDSLFDGATYKGAKILIANTNFGCGSSREHAPWALKDFGFEAIIAPSFADIFYNNSLKNQLLPIALPQAQVQKLARFIELTPQGIIEIDLINQEVKMPNDEIGHFDINPFRKQCLAEGLDDIAFVLKHADKIKQFESQHRA